MAFSSDGTFLFKMSLGMFFACTLLFRYILLCIWISGGSSAGCCSTTAPKMLDAFRNNILKRRTRAVVFPKKALLLLTPSFSKAILGGIPRGLAYSMEFDMYNMLPDTVEGWKPNILLNKIEMEKQHEETQQQVEVPKRPIPPNYSDGNIAQNEYYEPSNMPENSFYQFPFDKNEINRDSWDFGQAIVGNEQTHFTRNFHARPYLRKNSPSQFNSNGSEQYYSAVPPAVMSKFSDTIATASSWYDNQSYRERRQIFHQLETVGTILNINVKACIKRAMCEVTTHLKPYGESIMNDMIRLVLTLPIPNDISNTYGNDEYSYSHHSGEVNCAHRFAASCPYRVLHILTQNL